MMSARFLLPPCRCLPLVLGLVLGMMHLPARALDDAMPEFRPVAGIAGNFSSIGSDTQANLMTLWAEAFKRAYPNVNIQVQAAGSATAPPALTHGMANVGPMSRPMKRSEMAAFEQVHGYRPTAVPVAVDALAIFVNKDNPLPSLSLEEVDAIFSATRLCGLDHDIKQWGDLGLGGSWVRRRLQLFGRNSVSGTYGYFKEHALCRGDFLRYVNEQPGSAAVVQAVSQSLNGIGYSAIGYATSGVRAVPLRTAQGSLVMPEAATVLSGEYPLARFLYVYVNKAPHRPLPPLEAEFLRLVLSRQGQEIVVKDGYVPLPADEVRAVLAELGIREGGR